MRFIVDVIEDCLRLKNLNRKISDRNEKEEYVPVREFH